MKKRLNRVMIAAAGSGSGKTMITCGLLNLLKKKNMDVTSYKCGPDYIDPMFHKTVLGIYGGNLDTYFCDDQAICEILAGCDNEYAIMEGVMGIYDGLGGLDIKASSYDVACRTSTPVILVVDAGGSARTLLSVIKGILADDSLRLIRGIILNRVSKRFYEKISAFLDEELKRYGYDVRTVGYLPRIKDAEIGSRHLGLMMPSEISDIKEKIDKISDVMKTTFDTAAIVDIMDKAKDIEFRDDADKRVVCEDVNIRIAVAKDEAFCFYYKENLKLFEELGTEIVYFSPLHDKELPKDIHGIYFGGGYPELHLKELSDNKSMLDCVRKAIENGLPSLAECGGFMYLHEEIEDKEGNPYKMTGVIPGRCVWSEELKRFGYVEIESEDELDGMKGHEFHRYVSTADGDAVTVRKAGTDISYRSMYADRDHVWGFMHMYYRSAPRFLRHFVEVMSDGR